jgi:hypothetical protein
MLQLSLIYPYMAVEVGQATHTFPSWKEFLVDRLLKGKHHFYSALPACLLSGQVALCLDILRPKVLHWHKATFFPDFISNILPDTGAEDDDTDAQDYEYEEPSAARRVAYYVSSGLAYAATITLSAVVMTPIEAVCIHMLARPLTYGAMGSLGTAASLYRTDGVWNFYRGFLPTCIYLGLISALTFTEDSNTGLAPP